MAEGDHEREDHSFVYISVHILWAHHEGALRVINDPPLPWRWPRGGREDREEEGRGMEDRCAK